MIILAGLLAAAQPAAVKASWPGAAAPSWRAFVRGSWSAPRPPSRIDLLQRAVGRLPADRAGAGVAGPYGL